jgi:hypothetical protein
MGREIHLGLDLNDVDDQPIPIVKISQAREYAQLLSFFIMKQPSEFPVVDVRRMAVTQVTTVTKVHVDCDSYLKIGPNHKKGGSNYQARQVLFALGMTTIFETLVLETPPY